MHPDFLTPDVPGPHRNARVHTDGPPLSEASAVAILLHGRGGSADDILGLASAIDLPNVTYLAPEADSNSWYPLSFMAAFEQNRSHVESAHALIESLITQIAALGTPRDRVAIIGFSQGACLAADHAAKFPYRYGLIACCTGGLIGPPGTQFTLLGSLEQTPVFLGANDPDPHVPWSRVEETARVLESLNASVDLVRYPGLPHSINRDQVRRIREALGRIGSEQP